MKYQILFLVCVLAFATTVSADPLVAVHKIVMDVLQDIMYLIQHPTLENALAVVVKNGWGNVAPYVGGGLRMQAHDMFVKGQAGGMAEIDFYYQILDMA